MAKINFKCVECGKSLFTTETVIAVIPGDGTEVTWSTICKNCLDDYKKLRDEIRKMEIRISRLENAK